MALRQAFSTLLVLRDYLCDQCHIRDTERRRSLKESFSFPRNFILLLKRETATTTTATYRFSSGFVFFYIIREFHVDTKNKRSSLSFLFSSSEIFDLFFLQDLSAIFIGIFIWKYYLIHIMMFIIQ